MPLPNHKPNLYKPYIGGYLSIGTIEDKLNENRRKVGSVFTPLYSKIPFRKESLTSQDTNTYGVKLAEIKMKVGIDYNPTLYETAENKLIVKLGNSYYNIDKVDISNKTLILYLVTNNEKGVKLDVNS